MTQQFFGNPNCSRDITELDCYRDITELEMNKIALELVKSDLKRIRKEVEKLKSAYEFLDDIRVDFIETASPWGAFYYHHEDIDLYKEKMKDIVMELDCASKLYKNL